MRVTAVLSTLVLSVGLVAGCGDDGGDSSSSNSAYCKGLQAASADFATFDSPSPDFDRLDDALKTFHELANEAPAAVASEWKVFDDALTAVEKDLAAVGLTVKDLGLFTQGQLPEGVSADELAALTPKLAATFSKLEDESFSKATDKIFAHGKSECGVDLTGD